MIWMWRGQNWSSFLENGEKSSPRKTRMGSSWLSTGGTSSIDRSIRNLAWARVVGSVETFVLSWPDRDDNAFTLLHSENIPLDVDIFSQKFLKARVDAF